MFKLCVLACIVASVAAEADPVHPYAAAPLAAHATYAAAAPVAHATYAAAAPVIAPAVAAAPVVAPAASAYALPPTQIVNEAPIVEQVVEPVEQWGYKVAY